MKTRILMLLVLVAMPIGCTPSPGRFCREDKPDACWDADFGAKTMTLVLMNGQRAPGSIPLHEGKGDFDYYLDGAGSSQVQIKLLDRNAIGIRNSESDTHVFDRFVRR